MLKLGENTIGGIQILVEAKPVRRINLRVRRDGSAYLSFPARSGSVTDCEKFLESQWQWLVAAVARARSRAGSQGAPTSGTRSIEQLFELVRELDALWRTRLGVPPVQIRFRAMRSQWGVCNWKRRAITYSTMLAAKPRRQVEYVVVHELTHLEFHDHGPMFKARLDARMPDWRDLRRALNS